MDSGEYNKSYAEKIRRRKKGERSVEYMSVQDAASRWDVTEGFVLRYCAEGLIQGARQLVSSWVIPVNAPKPADMRRDVAASQASPGPIPMPLLNTPYLPGQCWNSIAQITDPAVRDIALAEYHYFSGQSEKASVLAERYLNHENMALRLSAGWLCVYASLAQNRISTAKRVLLQVQHIPDLLTQDTPPEHRALAVCVCAAASILLHLPVPEDLPPFKRYVSQLPPGLRLFALYVQAHHEYLNQRYEASIGIVETALALEGERYPIAAIYLHLVATMDYMSLRQPQQAKEHLLAAWALAQPDDLIQPFGEHHGLLGGMLEAVIKREWPDDFRRMITITYKFSAGWRKIHNRDTGHDVADDLSTTEFAIAMLAARNWSNKEIGAHLGISSNTVKLHLSSVFQKLGVTQRKELLQFMLK